MNNEAEARAYANGTLDGYNCGVENNPYESEAMKYAYRCGFEYGVRLYCQDNHPEDEQDE